jgi:bifunctional oligoribonuclease and PAP phosphatase NrnA
MTLMLILMQRTISRTMTTTSPIPQWQAATDAINAASSIVIVTHISPDGDAIGSALGLANGLIALGKQVTIADDDPVPDFLQFLPGAALFRRELTQGEWDVFISTDASDEIRTGKAAEYARTHSQTIINLDHHVTNTMFGDIHLVVHSAVSATEIVFDWWQHAGIELSREIAMPLLAGLVTDTIGFRVSSVSARTLQIAQELMLAGASLTEITQRTLDSRTYKEVELWKRALPSVEMDGAIIYGTVRLEDVAASNMQEVSDGGLVSFLNQVNEAMVAAVFKEQHNNRVELSFRSKPGFDVSVVAFALGGGGHKQAAGATVTGSLAEVQARVLPLLQNAVAQGKLRIV